MKIIGLITGSDIFRAFLSMLDFSHGGAVNEMPDELWSSGHPVLNVLRPS